jgi:hypothetical protein
MTNFATEEINEIQYTYITSGPYDRTSCVIKDEVLITVGCPIFPLFYIDSQIFVHRKIKIKKILNV